jgi:hypothetical protein
MAGVLQHLRSSTLNKRPNPASMVDGQVAINYASGSPGAFFKDTNGNLVKVGPVHVGATAPNVSPASGGTAGNSLGEQWLDTSGGTYVFKIWDGAAWRSEAGEFVNVTGDTMTGALGIVTGSASTPGLFFSGDANSGLYSPGADQVAISTGGAASATFNGASGSLAQGAITFSATAFSLTGGGATEELTVTKSGVDILSLGVDGSGPRITTGGALRIETNSAERLRIDSSGRLLVGTSSSSAVAKVVVQGITTDPNALGVIQLQVGTTTPADATRLGRIDFTDSAGGAGVWIQAERDGGTWTSGSSHPTRLLLSTTANGAASPAERMRIDSSGRVGIGTTTVNDLLHVKGGTIRAESSSSLTPGVSLIGGGPDQGWLKFGTPVGDYYSIKAGADYSGMLFFANGSERARIDSSGRLLVGTSTTSESTTMVVQGRPGDANGAGTIFLQGNYSGATDALYGEISFKSTGGILARISGVGDLAHSGDAPGRLVFSTTTDGASSPTERMRIKNDGYTRFANDGIITNPTLSFHGFDQSANDSCLYLNAKNASFTASCLSVYAERASNSAYSLAQFHSTHNVGISADLEFNLRADGEAFADGAWNGGGADYAEYFEWSDLNPSAEDRRGISVVLDGDKIREAVAGEDPIGVISGNPSVVGDAAWNKWSGKYLRDEFGTYIQEDYEVTDDDGNTVIQQRRKLNPAYDPDADYISREERPEWDCVGLMGKLRIRKGQVMGSRWIKMRDISDLVEEWLVR